MNHQFKPGDLALIIGLSRGTSPNIGMAVELIEKIATDGRFQLPDGREAINRGPECWVVEGHGLCARLLRGGWQDLGGIALAQESHLMPLRGNFEPEQEKSKEVEPCL